LGFDDHALTDEIGIRRTREVHALFGGQRGHERSYGFSPCLLGQNEWRGVLKANVITHGGDTECWYVPNLKALRKVPKEELDMSDYKKITLRCCEPPQFLGPCQGGLAVLPHAREGEGKMNLTYWKSQAGRGGDERKKGEGGAGGQ
jgi:hypothetical protein